MGQSLKDTHEFSFLFLPLDYYVALCFFLQTRKSLRDTRTEKTGKRTRASKFLRKNQEETSSKILENF